MRMTFPIAARLCQSFLAVLTWTRRFSDCTCLRMCSRMVSGRPALTRHEPVTQIFTAWIGMAAATAHARTCLCYPVFHRLADSRTGAARDNGASASQRGQSGCGPCDRACSVCTVVQAGVPVLATTGSVSPPCCNGFGLYSSCGGRTLAGVRVAEWLACVDGDAACRHDPPVSYRGRCDAGFPDAGLGGRAVASGCAPIVGCAVARLARATSVTCGNCSDSAGILEYRKWGTCAGGR